MKKLLIIVLICGISLFLFWYNRDKVSAEQRCINNWWNPENRFKWWDNCDVCYFPDESFCFITDFATWKCTKWDHYFEDQEYYSNALEEYVNEESTSEELENLDR